MLKKWTLTERPGDDGVTWFSVGPPLVDDPCARCGGESFSQVCPGDGGHHHHGCVHTIGGGLEAVCHGCYVQVQAEWTRGRGAHATT